MSYDELKNLSHEDLNLFAERLRAFFKMSVDDSFVQLRKHLENRFSRYQSSNADELIDVTISRLIRKVAEFERRGDRIHDLKAFALRMASLIIREYQRAMKKAVPLDSEATKDAESSSRPRELPFRPDPEIRAIEKEIEVHCMTACLEELSADKRTLLFDYYPDESLKPQQKKELRHQLALREAGAQPGPGSEASTRQINNLQAKVSKLKSKLSECLDECRHAKRSRNRKVAFLEAQQAGE